MVIEHTRDADAGSRGITGRLDIRDDKPRLHRNRDLYLVAHESPRISGQNAFVTDAVVPGEIVGRARRSARCEIGAARARDSADRTDPQRN